MYRSISVCYQVALFVPVDGRFFAIVGTTEAGAIETIDVVDVEWPRGAAKIEDYVVRFAEQGIPVELDWFAKNQWGRALEAARAKVAGAR